MVFVIIMVLRMSVYSQIASLLRFIFYTYIPGAGWLAGWLVVVVFSDYNMENVFGTKSQQQLLITLSGVQYNSGIMQKKTLILCKWRTKPRTHLQNIPEPEPVLRAGGGEGSTRDDTRWRGRMVYAVCIKSLCSQGC